MELPEEIEASLNRSKGRGRGRGGGGVAVLPAGVWDSLHGNDQERSKNEETLEKFLKSSSTKSQFDDVEPQSHRDGEKEFQQNKGFSKDLKGKDWSCPSCTNTNWSWRTNCNMCGTPKPFVPGMDGEHRDGLGGGFNERQERVAAATVEVDEEGFDDFGRRVKKETVVDDKKAKEEAALKRLQDKYKFLMPGSMDAAETLMSQKTAVSEKSQRNQADPNRLSNGSHSDNRNISSKAKDQEDRRNSSDGGSNSYRRRSADRSNRNQRFKEKDDRNRRRDHSRERGYGKGNRRSRSRSR